MRTYINLFTRVFVKPFYNENAGALVLIYTLMFFIVSTVDGAGLYAYHYSLVTSMLSSPAVYFLVFGLWFLYARKCAAFISGIIHSPHHSFLSIFNLLPAGKRFFLFLFAGAYLMLPLLSYAAFILYVGFHQHLYLPAAFAVLYLLFLCFAMAARHVYVLQNIHTRAVVLLKKANRRTRLFARYPFILLWFAAKENTAIWISIKIYSCGVLYLIARYNTATDYDTLIAFLFFNFGVLTNGVLVYLIRQYEEVFLSFYKSLPVPLINRFANYALLYVLLVLPELITSLSLMPVHLHVADAVSFCLCAYSTLLLMNSLLFLSDFSMKEFAVALAGLFCVQYIVIPTAGYVFLSILFFIVAIMLFFTRYHRFERDMEKESV